METQDEMSDESCPSRLVIGPETGTGVTVEVLVEQRSA